MRNFAWIGSLIFVVAGCSTPAPRSSVWSDAPVSRASRDSRDSRDLMEKRETPTRGLASWYGRKRMQGRRTASGERFDRHALTAAHRTLPFGTIVEVREPRSGRTVRVRINDRGPLSRKREIDLSYAAARQLGILGAGVAQVEIRPL